MSRYQSFIGHIRICDSEGKYLAEAVGADAGPTVSYLCDVSGVITWGATSAHTAPAAMGAEMDDLVPIRDLLSMVVITCAPYGLDSETHSSAFLSCHQNLIAEVATAR